MKTTTFGIASFLITVMTLMVVLNITTQTQMDTKMERELARNLNSALVNASVSKHYPVETEEELVADVISSIIQNASSNISLDMSVKAADIEKGILSVEMTGTYKKMNGNTKSITTSKTVVLESEDDMTDTYLIEFEAEDFNYKTYRIKKGEPIIVPLIPNINGKNFVTWTLNDTDVDVSSMTADNNYKFIARFD